MHCRVLRCMFVYVPLQQLEALVIIPTYNEAENIKGIIKAIIDLPERFDVLIVDDGSPDGTTDLVRSCIAAYGADRVHLIERKGKLGLGTAYIAGFRWALQRDYKFVCEMDADFSHDPRDLLRLVEACKNGADIAVGSRYVAGGKIENWPLDRHIYSRGGSLYTRLITFMPVKDATAGFVCYKREVLQTINLNAITFVGYAFQIEMKYAAWKLGFKIKEVPIVFRDRIAGNSKMNKGIIKEGVLGVLKIQYQSWFKNYRNRVRTSASD